MVQHREQIASVLHRAIQSVIGKGLNDPRVRGMISVTEVKVAPDMANATVMVSVHPQEATKLTMQGLKNASRYIRREVGEQIHMRRMPQLTFRVDESLKKQAAVLTALDEINREQQQEQTQPIDGQDETPNDGSTNDAEIQ